MSSNQQNDAASQEKVLLEQKRQVSVAYRREIMEWLYLLPVPITGIALLALLVSTHIQTHCACLTKPYETILSDAIVLFFATVAFISSLVMAWNLRQDND